MGGGRRLRAPIETEVFPAEPLRGPPTGHLLERDTGLTRERVLGDRHRGMAQPRHRGERVDRGDRGGRTRRADRPGVRCGAADGRGIEASVRTTPLAHLPGTVQFTVDVV
ncbi:hypothetical protein [Nocardia asteroides]|uniref:hypothetical protein n=1 Tax=Nocardia asteroides TaxID=1824 RepID=UPI00364AE674